MCQWNSADFLALPFDECSVDVFERFLMNVFHFAKHLFVCATFVFTDHAAGLVSGAEIHAHLMVTHLVDNKHQNLASLGFMSQILCQDGAETAVIVITL